MKLLHFLFLGCFVLPCAIATSRCTKRRVLVNPPALFDARPFRYSQIAVDTFTRVAHISGQVAINRTGSIIGKTLARQLLEVEKNLRLAREAVNADIDDILALNGYIVNLDPATDLAIFQNTGRRLGSPRSTVVGVTSLALDGLLVELEIDVAISKRTARKFRCGLLG